MPAGVDAAEAATLILSRMTAYQLLHHAAEVKRGQPVLMHGAAGAVGRALLTLGRMAEGYGAWRARRAGPRKGNTSDPSTFPIVYLQH